MWTLIEVLIGLAFLAAIFMFAITSLEGF